MAKLTNREKARQAAVRAYAINLGFDPDNLNDAQQDIINREIERTVGVALPPAAESTPKKGKSAIATQQPATPAAPTINPEERIAELERQAEESRLSMQRQAAMAGIAEGQGLSALYQGGLAYGFNTQLAAGFDVLSQKLKAGEQSAIEMDAIGFIEGMGFAFSKVEEADEVDEEGKESRVEYDNNFGLWDEEDEELVNELETIEDGAEAEIAEAIAQMGE